MQQHFSSLFDCETLFFPSANLLKHCSEENNLGYSWLSSGSHQDSGEQNYMLYNSPVTSHLQILLCWYSV